MPAPKLTPAQLLTLRAAADGKLWWSVVNNGYFADNVGTNRTRTVHSLVVRGLLIDWAPNGRPTLTDAGRALLADLDRKES